jgi:phage terminase large subunit
MQLVFPKKLEPLFHRPNDIRHVLIEGGRGGGKSHTVAEFLLLEGLKKPIRVLCGREVQKSISESVHTLLRDKINKYGYPYIVTEKSIKAKNGTTFIFAGIKDHTIDSIKSYEGVDVFWGEEAQSFSKRSLDVLIPTIRGEGSYFIWTMNRFEEADPIFDRLIHKKRNDVMRLTIQYYENKKCPQESIDEAEMCKQTSPEDYAHIWLGEPMSQSDRAVINRLDVLRAMERNTEPEGQIEVGVDVARFGTDTTQFYKRKGLKVIDERNYKGMDTFDVSNEAFVFSEDAHEIKVDDTGVGGGVSDNLTHKGRNVQMINFGGSPKDKDKYPNTISEMWFEFRELLQTEEVDLPDDRELLQQLTSRLYKFDVKGRRVIESKEDYKKRYGKSPDKADALLLCYYSIYSNATLTFF